jgi:Sporulation and spore germination
VELGPVLHGATVKHPSGQATGLIIALALVVGCAAQPTTTPSPTLSGGAVPTGSVVGASPSASAPTPSESAVAFCGPEVETPSPIAGEVFAFFSCGRAPLALLIPVARPTSAESLESRLEAAITALLAGPTQSERETGLHSWFSTATANTLNGVTIDEGGAAVIDFADFSSIIPNASTSAGRQQLISEIRATVFQFGELTSAELQFDGNCAAFWFWLEALCSPLLPAESGG